MIRLWVAGHAEPKGSTISRTANGHTWTRSANPNLQGWEQVVRNSLGTAGVALLTGPVVVTLCFILPQPQSKAPKPRSADPFKRSPVPSGKPDIDKLVRGTLDALNKIAFEDDGRVVDLHVSKRYGEPIGVEIIVKPLEESEV